MKIEIASKFTCGDKISLSDINTLFNISNHPDTISIAQAYNLLINNREGVTPAHESRYQI